MVNAHGTPAWPELTRRIHYVQGDRVQAIVHPSWLKNPCPSPKQRVPVVAENGDRKCTQNSVNFITQRWDFVY